MKNEREWLRKIAADPHVSSVHHNASDRVRLELGQQKALEVGDLANRSGEKVIGCGKGSDPAINLFGLHSVCGQRLAYDRLHHRHRVLAAMLQFLNQKMPLGFLLNPPLYGASVPLTHADDDARG